MWCILVLKCYIFGQLSRRLSKWSHWKILKANLVSTMLFQSFFFRTSCEIFKLSPTRGQVCVPDCSVESAIYTSNKDTEPNGRPRRADKGLSVGFRVLGFWHIDGLAQDCSNSIANALELLQYCAKPSICNIYHRIYTCFVELCGFFM